MDEPDVLNTLARGSWRERWLWPSLAALIAGSAGYAPVAADFSTPATSSQVQWAGVTAVLSGLLGFVTARAGGFALRRHSRSQAQQIVVIPSDQSDASDAPDVFISHISADQAWASWLQKELSAAGYHAQVQSWRIQAKVDLVRHAYESLSGNDCVILLVSHAYVASPYAAEEWTQALFESTLGTRLVLQVAPCDLPPILQGRIDLDISDMDGSAARSAIVAELISRSVRPRPGGTTVVAANNRFPGLGPAITNLPSRNLAFTGRLLALREIHTFFLNSRAGVCGRVINGLGGVGKSQLAIEYAHRYASEYDLIWWVTAASDATIVPDLLSLARALGIAEIGDQTQMLTEMWQRLGTRYRYLIVFDNANSAFELRPHWPRAGDAHVLVTSRSRIWGTLVSDNQMLSPMGVEESITFLCIRSGNNDEAAASRIAEQLGYLPLALEQAGAYVDETGTSLSRYEVLLRDRLGEILAPIRPTGYEHTVTTTWSMSIQQAAKDAPGARELLNLFAFLAPDGIPRLLVQQHPLELAADSLFRVVTDAIDYDLALRALASYSLVQAGKDFLRIHRLVQATSRLRLSTDEEIGWTSTALAIIDAAFPAHPEDIEERAECDQLFSHLQVVISHADRLGIEDAKVSRLLRRGGVYLHHTGDLARAQRMLEQALLARERDASTHSLDYAESLMDLARLGYHSSDNAALIQGRDYALRALSVHQERLGPDHPTVADDLTHIGAILRTLGDLERALELTQTALAIRLATYGEPDISVAESYHYLGFVHFTNGRMALARAALMTAKQMREDLLGPMHPNMGETLKLIGAVQRTVGEYEAAKDSLELSVRILTTAQGDNHIDTVAAQNELADTYRCLGMLDESADMFEHVLTVRQARHGDHPYVAGTLVRQSALLIDLNQLAEAEEALREGMSMYERTWGPESSFAADALSRLGEVLHRAGELNDARETLERAVRLCERSCATHPFMVDALMRLATLQAEIGDDVGAEASATRAEVVRQVCYFSLDGLAGGA